MSKRMDRRMANRRPFWLRRDSAALESGAVGVATAYDRARLFIRRTPQLADRQAHLRALVVLLAGFAEPYVGPADQVQAEGRSAGRERRFKASHALIDNVSFWYDLVRRHLRRIEPLDAQEAKWRELESLLHGFNQRFSRGRAPAA